MPPKSLGHDFYWVVSQPSRTLVTESYRTPELRNLRNEMIRRIRLALFLPRQCREFFTDMLHKGFYHLRCSQIPRTLCSCAQTYLYIFVVEVADRGTRTGHSSQISLTLLSNITYVSICLYVTQRSHGTKDEIDSIV